MTELLPCPHCSSPAYTSRGKVLCADKAGCGATAPDEARWNRRDWTAPAAAADRGATRAAVVLGGDDPHGDRAWLAQQRARARGGRR